MLCLCLLLSLAVLQSHESCVCLITRRLIYRAVFVEGIILVQRCQTARISHLEPSDTRGLGFHRWRLLVA